MDKRVSNAPPTPPTIFLWDTPPQSLTPPTVQTLGQSDEPSDLTTIGVIVSARLELLGLTAKHFLTQSQYDTFDKATLAPIRDKVEGQALEIDAEIEGLRAAVLRLIRSSLIEKAVAQIADARGDADDGTHKSNTLIGIPVETPASPSQNLLLDDVDNLSDDPLCDALESLKAEITEFLGDKEYYSESQTTLHDIFEMTFLNKIQAISEHLRRGNTEFALNLFRQLAKDWAGKIGICMKNARMDAKQFKFSNAVMRQVDSVL